MPGIDGLRRLVNRNDGVVRAVLVNGRTAWSGDVPAPGFGIDGGFGTVLRSTR